MSKYQVIFYSSVSNSRYSYFVKVPDMGDIPAESYLAIEVLGKRFSKLGVDIGEINCRKVG